MYLSANPLRPEVDLYPPYFLKISLFSCFLLFFLMFVLFEICFILGT